MRLLHIIATMNPISGGPCQGIRNSTPDLIKLGVYREIISLDPPSTVFDVEDSFIVHKLGPPEGPWRYSAKILPWLENNLGRFDVVILNGIWMYAEYALFKAFLSYRTKNPSSKIKFYIMPHGMLDPYFQRAPDRKLKAIRNRIYWRFIASKIINYADGLLFTCETELLLARESFKDYHPKKELNVLYGILPPPAFTVEMREAFLKKCPEVAGSNYILFISRIHKKKGVDLLLKAYEALLSNNPALIFPKLVIAGPGLDTPYGRKMTQIVENSTILKDLVFFPGMLYNDAKWGAFYDCEAFILPSHQENFGIAVVEALACGKPVLISDQINIKNEIEVGGAGLIGKDDEAGTLETLKTWINFSENEKDEMGRKAENTFKKYFTTEIAAIKLVEAIRDSQLN